MNIHIPYYKIFSNEIDFLEFIRKNRNSLTFMEGTGDYQFNSVNEYNKMQVITRWRVLYYPISKGK